MPRILGLLLILALMGCGDSNPPAVDIADFFRAGDIDAFKEYVRDNHTETRSQISSVLGDYLDFNINHDTIGLDSTANLLTWMIENYEQTSGITDFARQFALYQSWNRSELIKKNELDSLLGLYIDSLRAGRDDIFETDSLTSGYRSLGDTIKLSYINYIIGYYNYNRRQIDSALRYLSRAIQIGSLWDNLEIMAKGNLVMAKIHNVHIGDFYKSVNFYNDAISCFNRLGMNEMARYAHLGLGHDFLKIYKTNRAIRQFQSALEISNQIGDTSNLALSLNNIGEAFLDLDQLDSAALYAEQSLNLKQDYLHNHATYISEIGYSLSLLGLIKHAQKDYVTSREYYERADSIFSEGSDSAGLYMNQLRLASLYLDSKSYDSASNVYRSILDATEKYEVTLTAIFGLSVCQYYTGQEMEAEVSLKYCIDLFENSRSKLPSAELKAGLLSDKMGFYQLLSKIYVDQYHKDGQTCHLDSAFRYLEKSRAIVFTEQLQSEKRISSETREMYLHKISGLYKAMILGQGEKTDVIGQIEAVEDSLFNLDYKVGAAESFNGALINSKFNADNLFDKNQVVLEYSLSNYGSFCLVISRNMFEVFPISMELEFLVGRIKSLIECINRYPGEAGCEEGFTSIAGDLYNTLVPANLIKDYDNITIIPSGPLNYLPFEVLTGSDGKYLIESKAISYAPSVNSLQIIMDRKNNTIPGDKILAFGDPLVNLTGPDTSVNGAEFVERDFTIFDDWDIKPIPATRTEVEKIEAIFGPDRVEVYLAESANETNFKKLVHGNYTYMHLASHGVSDIYNPRRSAMIFSFDRGKGEDGLLHVDEIYHLNLQTDLVFLSACQTGTGKFLPGEGVMNLARPFLIAGSASAVATSWNINDKSTSEFVDIFYNGLQKGHSKTDALMYAKRQFIENRRKLYRHPYFWAPFILIGDWH